MIDSRVFIVWSLDDGVDWASLLAEATVNTLSHIDVISCSPTTSVRSRFTLNGDGVCWTGSCAQFASNTSKLC